MIAVLGLTLSAACGEASEDPDGSAKGGASSTGGKVGNAGSGAAAGRNQGGSGAADPGTGGKGDPGSGGAGHGGAAGGDSSCDGDALASNKRLVRLTFSQVAHSVRALVDDVFADASDKKYKIGAKSESTRAFPALAGTSEGELIHTGNIAIYDGISMDVGAYALANVVEITGCGATPTDTCAWGFAQTFAERAIRRPLDADELENLERVYDEVKTLTGSPSESAASAMSAVLHWPQFTYRYEFGDAPEKAGSLSAYELASALSYALTDGPPDDVLLDAAAKDRLGTEAELRAHATRLLATGPARANLESALLSRFELEGISRVVADGMALTPELLASQRRELELFLSGTLWTGPLTRLLTSNRTWINPALATFYDVPAPGSDPNQFLAATLPEERAGLFALAGFFSSRPRGAKSTVTDRGAALVEALLCSTISPHTPELEVFIPTRQGSERENVNARKNAVCGVCHAEMDAVGLALDTFDTIGRYRTSDAAGLPIDPRVTLPSSLGGAEVEDAVALQAVIAESPRFATCFARNMLTWSLNEAGIAPESCAVKGVASGLAAGDGSLSALLAEIAASRAFRERGAP